jgi:hypothetical protein
MNFQMESELRWLKAVEKERLYKNSYPWVLPQETIPTLSPKSQEPLAYFPEISGSLNPKSLKKDSTAKPSGKMIKKINAPSETIDETDIKSPTFHNFNSIFNTSPTNSIPNLFKSSSPIGRDKKMSNKLSNRSSLKQSALSVNSIQDSGLISKSSLRDKSEVMQAIYTLFDNLEKSEGPIDNVLNKYTGRARKVCEVVLEHINQDIYFDEDPLSKVVELSRIQEVHSDSSLDAKSINTMLGNVLDEIKQVKQDVRSLSNSSN